VNYVDRINLTVSRDALQTSFGLSDIVFGWLLSAYNLTYAISQLPAGLLLDRFGVRRLNLVSAATISVASFGSATASCVRNLFSHDSFLASANLRCFQGTPKRSASGFRPTNGHLP
jgi:MFS family permease